MQFSVNYERDEIDPKTGPITVGWFLSSDKVAVLYDAPERLTSRQTNKGHAKSAARCPAVVQMESRYFVVKCPFDLHLGFKRDDAGKAVLLVSLELEEVLSLSDRILVIYEGELVGEFDPKKTTREELGLYMSGAKKKEVQAS